MTCSAKSDTGWDGRVTGWAALCLRYGESDHVHLLVSYPPTISISQLVNRLKADSSRMLRYGNVHLKRLGKNGAIWSPSYFAASAGSVTVDVLKRYIEEQNTPE